MTISPIGTFTFGNAYKAEHLKSAIAREIRKFKRSGVEVIDSGVTAHQQVFSREEGTVDLYGQELAAKVWSEITYSAWITYYKTEEEIQDELEAA